MAPTDPLTGLPDRRAWEQALAKRAADPARRPFAVALLDLDDFEALDAQSGDRLLREAAAAWRSELREGDVLARLDGAAFGAVLRVSGYGAAEAIGHRLAGAAPGDATCSVGVVLWDGDEGAAEMVARAEETLGAAQAAGPGRALTV